MPERPYRPCKHTACPNLTRDASGYCEAHKGEGEARQKEASSRYNKSRGSASAQGYDKQWASVRLAYLRRNPICQDCLEKGIIVPATIVHHLQTVKARPDLRLDMDNLRSLCVSCHEARHPLRRQR